jgi:hypothetical protein
MNLEGKRKKVLEERKKKGVIFLVGRTQKLH